MRLFRPVGLYELQLVHAAGWTSFPPRLPEQPIFYPVLNQGYAEEIAQKWNPNDPNSGFAGVVTAFDIEDRIVAAYEPQVVGGTQHAELWVPAEKQKEFEAAFLSKIQPLVSFVGERIRSVLPGYDGPTGTLDERQTLALVEAVRVGPVVGGPMTEG